MKQTFTTRRGGRAVQKAPAPRKEKGTANKLVHLRMTEDLHGYLVGEAITKGRTLSGLIIFACEEYRRAYPEED